MSGDPSSARQTQRPARAKVSLKAPEFDGLAVGRVGARVRIETLELVGAEFSRSDTDPLGSDPDSRIPKSSGIRVEWNSSTDTRRLGCVITFATVFDDQNNKPYNVAASYRLIYTIPDKDPLPADTDVETFMHWNAVFNAWPYWREYLASTVNRAGLPRFVLPIARMPLPGMITTE